MFNKSIIILIILISSLIGEEIFNLKDGSSINGERVSENETSITVQTSFGEVIINKYDLVIKEYIVVLRSGETLIGTKKEDNEEYIILITQGIGEITLDKKQIASIKEMKLDDSKNDVQEDNKAKGLFGLISGTGIVDNLIASDRDADFTEGQEQLISLFADPTAHTLKRSTLYMSGLSFGFGLTDNVQVTTKWSGFFYGDLNLRLKYKAYSSGNWEKQSAFAFGVDYHQRWWPNKYKWVSGSVVKDDETYHYGGWTTTLSKDITAEDIEEENTCIENGDNDCAYINENDDIDDLDYMFELFGTYTFSKARSNLKGQITHTIGTRAIIARNGDDWELFPRLYYGVDFDITPRFKVITMVIYDNHMLEPYQGGFFSDGEDLEISSEGPIDKDEVLPVHLDFGFIYAFNNNFRFGIHFQQPWVGFYWKF